MINKTRQWVLGSLVNDLKSAIEERDRHFNEYVEAKEILRMLECEALTEITKSQKKKKQKKT